MEMFKNLRSFADFKSFTNNEHYNRVSDDHFVILSDIRGSTKAIAEGRYKEVNFVGATSIAVITNASKPEKVPFVFGGDGATFVVNTELLAKVKNQLVGLIRQAKANYGFELRIGVVPVADVSAKGSEILVSKYALSEQQPLAFFTGGGLAVAEALVKSDEKYLLRSDDQWTEPNLDGLSCRWNPIPAKSGVSLSMLVMAREKGFAGLDIYKQIISDIEANGGFDISASSPVEVSQMSLNWLAKGTLNEGKLRQQLLNRWRLFLKANLMNFFVKFCIVTGIEIGGFNPQKYASDTVQNADFKKVDDLLRMVVDCTPKQVDHIRKILEIYRIEGKIFYGTHSAKGALMTCLVQDAMNDHVHFIDGMNGGYTLAAVELKAQIKAANPA
jgi:hypothetical protein